MQPPIQRSACRPFRRTRELLKISAISLTNSDTGISRTQVCMRSPLRILTRPSPIAQYVESSFARSVHLQSNFLGVIHIPPMYMSMRAVAMRKIAVLGVAAVFLPQKFHASSTNTSRQTAGQKFARDSRLGWTTTEHAVILANNSVSVAMAANCVLSHVGTWLEARAITCWTRFGLGRVQAQPIPCGLWPSC